MTLWHPRKTFSGQCAIIIKVKKINESWCKTALTGRREADIWVQSIDASASAREFWDPSWKPYCWLYLMRVCVSMRHPLGFRMKMSIRERNHPLASLEAKHDHQQIWIITIHSSSPTWSWKRFSVPRGWRKNRWTKVLCTIRRRTSPSLDGGKLGWVTPADSF